MQTSQIKRIKSERENGAFGNREKEKEKQHLFIQLLGVPASGKTTLAKYLGERLGFRVLEEYPVSETPLFDKYYSDPDKWAFSIQALFLWFGQMRFFSQTGRFDLFKSMFSQYA